MDILASEIQNYNMVGDVQQASGDIKLQPVAEKREGQYVEGQYVEGQSSLVCNKNNEIAVGIRVQSNIDTPLMLTRDYSVLLMQCYINLLCTDIPLMWLASH